MCRAAAKAAAEASITETDQRERQIDHDDHGVAGTAEREDKHHEQPRDDAQKQNRQALRRIIPK